MSDSNDMITWTDESSRANAIAQYSESTEHFYGISRTSGSIFRTFENIEPDRSVRPEFNHQDYGSFRPGETTPKSHTKIIKMCNDAYDKVGIIRNIIDLMGDFGSQGIGVVHQDRSVEKFCQQWFEGVHGPERSERFLNNFYRSGNVIPYRSMARATPTIETYLKSMASDVVIERPDVMKREIPWRYTFLNPLSVSYKDGLLSLFLGKSGFTMDVGRVVDIFAKTSIPPEVLEALPQSAREAILRGERVIPLDPSRLQVFHYKKDDWQLWANPMIYAILDDIIMLEKMRLADLSALDGAISNIRLWTLGNLEHKILPSRGGINKLRNILSSNVGGGTMELVWGPELTFKESTSEVYKFLGSEKYVAVLNSIYAGLGVPPTLTGMASNGGGFTNNFISLKTLVERLQYGRDALRRFWQGELEILRQAMGFRHAAHVKFDNISLSDEAAEKKLLIELADRDIISHETLLQHFKELPQVEKIRLRREVGDRANEKNPQKAGPYHRPQHKQDLEKIALQSGKVLPSDVGLTSSVPKKLLVPPDPNPPEVGGGLPSAKSPPKPNGRPSMKPDSGPRKQRVAKPKSKPGKAEFVMWADDAWEKISEVLTGAFLGKFEKKNLRQLTKAQFNDLEKLKLDVLTNLELMETVDVAAIHRVLADNLSTPQELLSTLAESNISLDSMPTDKYRRSVLGVYITSVMDDE